MNTYFNETMRILSQSVESMDMETFGRLADECCGALERGSKIIVSGLGKNVPVCDKFVGTMNSLGMRADFMNTNSAVHGDLGMVREGDLVIILTKSGETVESVYLTQLLKARGADMWLLSLDRKSVV